MSWDPNDEDPLPIPWPQPPCTCEQCSEGAQTTELNEQGDIE